MFDYIRSRIKYENIVAAAPAVVSKTEMLSWMVLEDVLCSSVIKSVNPLFEGSFITVYDQGMQ